MTNLDQAIALACQAHRDQTDIAGKPYILHPLRLMMAFSDEQSQIIAVLHDTVEDSPVTVDQLHAAGFTSETVEAIDALTRRPDETYEAFIDRVSANPLAASVKIEDLKDNMDTTRLNTLTAKDHKRLDRYHRALKQLQLAS